MNMPSHMLDPSRGIIGFAHPLVSARDRRDRRRRNPKRGKASAHMLVEIPSGTSRTESSLLAPDMIAPALLTVEKAFGEVPRKAKQTHRNDPSRVNKILLCDPPSDRI